MASECSVCYCEGATCRLTCSHEFCKGCVKSWYQKGSGSGCPMCRADINFKGFHKLRRVWNEVAWEAKCADVFGEFIDASFEDMRELADEFGPEVMEALVDDLKDGERTYRFLRAQDCSPDEIDYFLMEDYVYYSDRHMEHYYYPDEPLPALATRYPGLRVRTPLSVLC